MVRRKKESDYYKLSSWCKECSKKNTKKNIDKDRKGHYERQKPYQEANQEIRNKRAREWRVNNPVKNHENQSGYYSREKNSGRFKMYHIRRKIKDHSITTEEWNECKKYFDYKCAYCGIELEDHFRVYAGRMQKCDFHREHVDDKGANDLSNCVPSCGNCNSQKWEFEFDVWYNDDNDKYMEKRHAKIIKWIKVDHKRYIGIKTHKNKLF